LLLVDLNIAVCKYALFPWKINRMINSDLFLYLVTLRVELG